jgi:hypothetical protein
MGVVEVGTGLDGTDFDAYIEYGKYKEDIF